MGLVGGEVDLQRRSASLVRTPPGDAPGGWLLPGRTRQGARRHSVVRDEVRARRPSARPVPAPGRVCGAWGQALDARRGVRLGSCGGSGRAAGWRSGARRLDGSPHSRPRFGSGAGRSDGQGRGSLALSIRLTARLPPPVKVRTHAHLDGLVYALAPWRAGCAIRVERRPRAVPSQSVARSRLALR